MTKPFDRYVLLDRDGVLNVAPKHVYITHPDELALLDGVGDAVRQLNDCGFGVLVISNQQCIGKGIISDTELDAISARLSELLDPFGASIVEFFYCPHLADDGCACRKPEPGLILQAQGKYGFDPAATFMAGDSFKDIEAAHAAGCNSILVLTGNDAERYRRGERPEAAPDFVVETLLDAARQIATESV